MADMAKLGSSSESAEDIENNNMSEADASLKYSPTTKSAFILLVEDNYINRKVAAAVLRNKGWNFDMAENGKDAIEKFKKTKYDIILMDVQMPIMDGYIATAAIREIENENGGHIPILAMTAHAMKGDREKCLESGMDGYVSKPIDSNELYSTIERFLNNTTIEQSKRDNENEEKPIDLDKLMQILDGNEELFKEIAEHAINEFPKMLEQLKAVIDNKDYEKVRFIAHSIKGEVGNFDAKKLYELAYKLEIMGKEYKLENASEVFVNLEKEMELFIKYLKERL